MSPNSRRILDRAVASVVASFRHFAGHIPAEHRNRTARLEPLESRVLLSRVEGIDVSQFQGTVDWNQVRSAGKEFAFVRASSGDDASNAKAVDTRLSANAPGGAAAGVLIGVYHTARPDTSAGDALDEADFFLSAAGQYMQGGWLRPVVAVERNPDGMTKAQMSQWVNTFYARVEEVTGVRPLIYANTDYATNYLDTTAAAGRDLWLARYNNNNDPSLTDPQVDQPQTPSGYPNPYGSWNEPLGGAPSHHVWDFWQYTSQGSCPGIDPAVNTVDLNVFQGDRARLESEFVIQAAGKFQLNVNFGPYETDAPSGYVNVANQPFGPILGYEMGWLQADAVPVRRTAGTAPDTRYRTYVRPGYQSVDRTFEVAVPSGTYGVRVVAGSPDEYGSTTKFWVEGTNVINGVTNSTYPFLTGVATVTVTDGRLTITSDAATAPNSRLAFVDIVDASRTSAPPAAPSNINATPASSTAIDVRWTDNADNEGRSPAGFDSSTWGQVNEGYKVERRDWNGSSWSSWSTRGYARSNAELYHDTGLSPGTQYHYRVAAVNGAGSSAAVEGTPVTTAANNDQQTYSASGNPWQLPALIQAEHFDRGGEGISYHDTSTGSAGGFYRDGGMDVGRIGVWGPGTPRLPRSHRLGWFRPGEWVEYTVDAPVAGDYTLEFRISAPGSGAKFHASTIQGGVETNLAAAAPGGKWDVPNTGDWDHFQAVEQTVRLPAGVQVIRVYADQAVVGNPGVMDFDWMRFTAGVDLSVSGVADADEESVGRHIPVNDDHDELNTDPAGQPLPDNQADAAEGHRINPSDTDLVSATLNVGGSDGTWWLEFPSDIRVWRSNGSGGYEPILSGEDVAVTPGAQIIDLKIEGIGASFDARSIELRAVVAPVDTPPVSDTVRITVASADLDADSDNDDGYGLPSFSHAEDRIEGDATREGKTLFTGDTQRVPISLLAQLPPTEMANAKIRLTYSAADLSGTGGPLRLWRSATSQDPADFVAPGEYTASQLGLGATAQELILYMEGVALTTDAPSRLIRAEIDPDGSGSQGFVLEDHVYVTVRDDRPAAIEGYVWDDRNGDGIRNSTTTFAPGDPPDVVYVIDISGSTLNPYRGTPVGDLNGDGRHNTILDGEIAGFLNLNQYLHQDLGFGSTARVALVVFSSDAKVLDLDPRSATALSWTSPAADLDGNLTPDVEQIISGLKVGHEGISGWTDYEVAFQSTSKVLEAMGAMGSGSTVVFLSDGYPNEPTDSPSHYQDEVTVLGGAGVNLRAFGAGTGASLYHLKRIDPNAEIFTTVDPLAQQVFGQDTQQITVFTEPGLGGWTVFADLDADGQFDPGEPHDVSDADGSYRISGLAPGSYTIRQVLQDDWQQTAPTGGTYAVTVVAGQVVGGNHFGNRHISDADLDVDSDNNNGTSAPDRSSNEDAIEGDAARLGKVIQINNGDSDSDGIPGYADLQSSGTFFTPVVLDLSGLSLSLYATVRFTYSGSPFYSADPASGRLRIWRKDGGDSRTYADYVRPGATYYASGLGITSSTPVVTLYIEGVVPTAKDVDRLIRVDVDPDGFYGPADIGTHDLVYVTAGNQPGMTDFTDSDGDALPDVWESAHGLDPLTPNPADADGDADGLSDFGEFAYGTNPVDTDTDDDLLSDGWEADDGRFDPLNPDQDGNGAIDGLDDPDGDALNNVGEENHGTDPYYFDSDNDLLPDGWEVQYGLDPLNSDENGNGTIDSEDDNDGEGLNNLGEANQGTDPTNVDTDGDGVSDLDEANQGSNPTDASDGGQAPPDDMKSKFRLTVGDNSGSHSERWALKAGDKQHTAPDFGKVGSGDYFFDAGKSYDVRLIHLGSKLKSPDYDWVAAIGPTLGQPPLPHFIIDDNQPKVLQNTGNGGDSQWAQYGPVTQRTAHLHIPLLDADVDSNNDGGFDPPADNKDEDRLEQDAAKGKVVWATTGDLDNGTGDGVPDYADFGGITGAKFVPLVLRLSENVNQAEIADLSRDIEISFSYADASDPGANLGPDAAGGYKNPPGLLRLWTEDAGTNRTKADHYLEPGKAYSAKDKLGLVPGTNTLIYVEAVAGASDGKPRPITVQVTVKGKKWSGTLKDVLHVLPLAVDVDVDSNNNNQFNAPARDAAEDEVENVQGDPARPGKLLVANDDDGDLDGIPDFADGFNWDGVAGNADNTPATAAQGERFVPLVVAIPKAAVPAQNAKLWLKIEYDESTPGWDGNPNGVTRTGTGTAADPYVYTPENGVLRLWTKDGSQARSSREFNAATNPGDFLPATNEAESYYTYEELWPLKWQDDGKGNWAKTFYVESVRPGAAAGDIPVTIKYDPDGAGGVGFIAADAVRMTAFGMSFIRQDNSDVPRTGDDATLMVSKFQTDVNLPDTASFDGPPGANPDPDTFRVQLSKMPAGINYQVRVDTIRGGARQYSHTFDVVSGNNVGSVSTYRINEHLRLVSNAPPATKPAGFTYDDEYRDHQTVLVKLEDQVKATVLLGGVEVASTSLQVGRPPSEGGPKAIRTVDVNFVTVTGVSSDPGLTVSRMSEDWAQIAIRFSLKSQSTVTPVTNVLSVEGTATAAGQVKVEITADNGATWNPVAINVANGATAAQIAADLGAAIAATSGLTSVVSRSDDQHLVVVNRGTDVDFRNLQTVAGVTFIEPPLNVNDGITLLEGSILGLNFKDSDDSTLDIIAVPNVDVLSPGTLGATGGDYLASNLPGWHNTIIIREDCVDTDDAGWPTTAGHEAGHAIFDVGNAGHSTSTDNLFYAIASSTEAYNATKRLTDAQNTDARTDSGPGTPNALLKKT